MGYIVQNISMKTTMFKGLFEDGIENDLNAKLEEGALKGWKLITVTNQTFDDTWYYQIFWETK